MAGVYLHKKIIENTEAQGTDQGHLDVLHASFSAGIADRTDYLLGKTTVNPADGVVKMVQSLIAGAASQDKNLVVGVPCNTFHSPQIFDVCKKSLEELGLDVEIINMIRETGEFIKATLPDIKKIGLLSTTGTRQAGVYEELLSPSGLEIVQLDDERQLEIHDSIYNPQWGIKSTYPVSAKSRGNFEKYIQALRDQGAEAVILGCTEIPLAVPEQSFSGVALIDPMVALARALIKKVAEDKLKPLAY